MTENTPEPTIQGPAEVQNAPTGVEERTGVEETGEEFVPPPSGEQGTGEFEPGDDSGNPYAGVDVAEIEAEQGGDGDA